MTVILLRIPVQSHFFVKFFPEFFSRKFVLHIFLLLTLAFNIFFGNSFRDLPQCPTEGRGGNTDRRHDVLNLCFMNCLF